MRTVLLQSSPWRPDMPALGLPTIQGALRTAGLPCRLVDLNLELFEQAGQPEWWEPRNAWVWGWPLRPPLTTVLERLQARIDRRIRAVLGDEPALVGIPVLSWQKAQALWLAARVKALRPDVAVVLGGPQCFPQYEPGALVADPHVDYVVVGEGEAAIVDLVRWHAGGATGDPPAGVMCHDGRSTPPRPLDADLDKLPFPDFDGLPLARYTDRGRLPIFTSRGCVKSCVYCIEQRIWERFRYRSAAHVHAEIRQDVERFGATRLEFNDSVFNGHIRVLEQLCDKLIASGWGLSWGGQGVIRAEMSPRVLAKLRASGCGYITYGFESASQKVLDRMKKRVDMRVAARVIRDTHEAGIGQQLNLMFGFPGETEEDFQETLDFLRAHARWITRVNPSDAFTAIIPGTELYEHAADFGVVDPDAGWFWSAEENTWPVRLGRFERLLKLVGELGIENGYRGDRLANRDELLGHHAAHRRAWSDALQHYDAHAAALGVPARSIPGYDAVTAALGAGLRATTV